MKKNLLFSIALFLSLQVLYSQPSITSFTPLSAKPGDLVTLSGTGFDTTIANNIVYFGATRATVTTASATSLSVVVPLGATYAPISVLNISTFLVANSLVNFTPIFAPAKTNLTATDFAPKADFASGINPNSLAFGDLDNDGKPEMVVANVSSNTVSVYKNTSSSGTIASAAFATKVDFTTGTSPFSLAIADLDNDGKLDLAVANSSSNTISVLRNTSIGGTITSASFAVKVDFATGTIPYSIAIGDLDGDGKPDLAVANQSSNNVSILRNTSTSGTITSTSFATKVDFATGSNPRSIAIGDLDGDGKPDLAVANYFSSTVSVFRNTSTSGTITTASFATKVDFTSGGSAYFVAIGDINSDSKPDLVISNLNVNTISVFRNTSTSGSITTASFATKVDFATGLSPRRIAVGDINGDGKLDLAVANRNSNTLSIFRNTSISGTITTASFAPKVDLTTGADPFSIAICDIDGDGKAELAVTNYSSNTVSVFRNTEIFLPGKISFTPLSAKPGDLITLTGTGFDSIAANNIVFFGATRSIVTTASTTSLSVIVPVSATYAPISVLNTSTFLAANSLANFTPIFAPAKTNLTATDFAPKVDFASGINPSSLAFGDLDNDGKPEMVVVNASSNTFSVYKNTSSSGTITSASFSTKVDFTTGISPFSLAIADLDSDGKLDLAVANSSSNTISVFRNTSTIGTITTASFAVKVDFATGSAPSAVAIADIDDDGKPELVVANRNSNTLSILRNTSTSGSITTASFSTKVDFSTGNSPNSIAIGDINGDGKPDLAVAVDSISSVSVLRNTSTSGSITTTSFDTKVDFATGINPNSIAIGDIDGDGKPDLVVANRSLSTVSVMRNTSTSSIITTASLAIKVDFAVGTLPRSVSIGDIDGDGKPDLVIANSGSNMLSVLRNTSTSGTITTASFSTKVDFTTGINPWLVAVGDLDGDGKPDLAVANQSSNNVSVLRNSEIIVPIINSFAPLSAKPGDLVIINGSGFDTTAANNIVFFGATRATVTTSSISSLSVIVPASATYAPISVLNTSTISATNSLTNFNPIFTPSKTNITAADFSPKVDFAAGTGAHSVAFGDLDNDGKPDMAVVNYSSSTVSVFKNTSITGSIVATSFSTKVDFTTSGAAFFVAIGDIDSDGKPDLVVSNYNSTVSVLRNTTTSDTITPTSFANKVDFATVANARSVAIGDLDGDGKPDLAVANDGSSTISVLRNTSTVGTITAASFATKVDFTSGLNPYSIAIGDLDGDGKADLAVVNGNLSSVSVFRNTSSRGTITSASFATKVDFTTGTYPRSVAIGDLDGDGKLDLAVANYNTNSVSVLRNTSTIGTITTASFATKVDFTIGTNPFSVAIGDINGDGKPDLALANAGSNTLSVLRNTSTNGTITSASFATKVDFTAGTFPCSIAICDINGDGKPELAVANYSSNNISVFRNAEAPNVISFTPSSGPIGTSITITGANFNAVTAVRFNGVNASYTVNSGTSIIAIVPPMATTGAISVVNALGTGTSGSNFTVIADLIVSTNLAVSGTYNNIIVTGTGVANLIDTLTALGNTTIQTGGTINFGTKILSGIGTFSAQSGSRLIVGSSQGLNATGISGNIQVNGARTINPGARVEFNATSNQSTGNLLTNIDTLIVNVSGGVLTLQNNLTVNNRLDLIGSSIVLGANNLTVGASGSIINTSSTNYVRTNGSGSLRRTVQNNSTNVLYPIGSATSYTPAQVQLNGTSTTDVISVRVFDGVLSAATSGTPIASSLVNRTWVISENVVGGSNATITLQWNGTDEVGSFNRALSAVSRFNSGTNAWTFNPSTFGAATGSDPYTRSVSGITSLTAFTVGDSFATSLPVNLIAFTAKALNNDVLLSWSTASEQNNKGFAIERSIDGENFNEIDFVDGKDFSLVRVDYKSLDQNAFDAANTLYYRLRQVDFDGTTSYSDVVSVTRSDVPAATLNVYPNPFTQGLSLEIVSSQDEAYNVIVTDLQGRTVATSNVSAVKGLNTISMNEMDELKAGIYFVKLIGEETITLKVVKAN